MSTTGGAPGWWSVGHPLAGTTRLVVGFLIGALFALFPMYYFYSGRDAGLRGGAAHEPAAASPVEAVRPSAEPPSRGASKPFASRMTYELSHLPEERAVPAPLAAPAARAPPVRAPSIAAVPSAPAVSEALAERVANARPISAVPPDPRDRTREIEREALKPEYREPARVAKAPPSLPAGKVIEGREVELKPRLPETPTRPIIAGAAVDTRAEIEAERQKRGAETPALRTFASPDDGPRKAGEAAAVVAPGGQVAGVSPITRAPEPLGRVDAASSAKGAAGGSKAAPKAADPAPAASSDVETRLDSTREWLAAAPPTTHTIQLMGTNSEEQLKAHLKSLSKMLEPAKLYIFRTRAQGKPSITVVYGAYADRASAVQALDKLPAAITANRPVLRTVNGIRTEMKQHKTE